MLKKILIYISCFLLTAVTTFSQSQKFVWLSDLSIGAPGSEEALSATVAKIKAGEKPAFVVITGNCSEKGKTDELERAREILDSLSVKYYIIPGIQDSRSSESFGAAFRQIFGDDRFCFDLKSIKFIGLSSAPLWSNGRGHFHPEDIAWLDSVVMNSPSQQKLVFFSDQSLNDEVDNWYSVYNILTRGNARCFLSGNSQKTQVHSLSGIPELSNGSLQRKNQEPVYSTVSVLKDTLLFSEIASDESVTDWAVIPLNEKYAPSVVDTTESNNYYTEFIWVKELNRTVNAAPVVINEKIYLPTISGEVYCFDSNGNVLWKAQAHAPISGRVAVAQGVAVVATTEGDIITYDAETGRVIQSIGTDEKLTSTPVIFKTTYRGDETYGVLIGTATGKMLCFELSSLNVIWENKSATGLIQSVPVPVNDRVVFGSWDGSLYCVDALTGELNWKWNESRSSAFSPAACVPQVGGGAVFVVSPDHYLSKIDLLLGKTIWRKREFDAWESVGISSDKKRLYVKSAFNKFFIVSAADGKRLKEYDLKNGADYAAIEPREFGTDVLTGTEHGFVWQLSSLGPKKLFYMGAARITGVIQTGDNTFIAGNVDGKLVLFSMPEEN